MRRRGFGIGLAGLLIGGYVRYESNDSEAASERDGEPDPPGRGPPDDPPGDPPRGPRKAEFEGTGQSAAGTGDR